MGTPPPPATSCVPQNELILTPAQVETFDRDGCVFPVRVMSTAQAQAARDELEDFERRSGGPLKGDLRHKSHLLFPYLSDLVHHTRCTDVSPSAMCKFCMAAPT